MTPERRKFSWLPIILQTLVLLGAVIGFALANEHRITVLETDGKVNKSNLDDTMDVVRSLQENQIRLTVLIDAIEKRHLKEDREHK